MGKGEKIILKLIIVYFLSLVFFLIILPGTVICTGLLADRILNFTPIIYPPYNQVLSLLLILWGALWMAWSLFSLINLGKGHPQEFFGKDILPATQQLVILGPYRYTRNPMGYGWFNIVAAAAVKIGSISTLLIVLPITLITVVWYLKHFEEKKLMARFGEEYIQYQKEVPIIFPRGPAIRRMKVRRGLC